MQTRTPITIVGWRGHKAWDKEWDPTSASATVEQKDYLRQLKSQNLDAFQMVVDLMTRFVQGREDVDVETTREARSYTGLVSVGLKKLADGCVRHFQERIDRFDTTWVPQEWGMQTAESWILGEKENV